MISDYAGITLRTDPLPLLWVTRWRKSQPVYHMDITVGDGACGRAVLVSYRKLRAEASTPRQAFRS